MPGGPVRPDPARDLDRQPTAQMHGSPDPAITGQYAGRHDDVSEYHRDEQVRRPPVYPVQPDKRGPDGVCGESDTAADQRGEQPDKGEVHEPLAGVEVPDMSSEPTGEQRQWPAQEPTQVTAFEPNRATYQRDRRPPAEDHAERG